MKNKNQEKQAESNPLPAVTTGIVIGASIAAAGVAAILQDKNKREKVKKVVKDVKKQVTGYVEDIKKKAEEKIEEGKEKVTEEKEELKHKAKKSIDSTQDVLKETKKDL